MCSPVCDGLFKQYYSLAHIIDIHDLCFMWKREGNQYELRIANRNYVHITAERNVGAGANNNDINSVYILLRNHVVSKTYFNRIASSKKLQSINISKTCYIHVEI